MKAFSAIIILVLVLLTPVYALCDSLGYMRISLIRGDVQVKTPDSEDWGPASINSPIEEGDQVWVPDGGRVELQLNAGTYVRLDQNSALQVLSMDKDSSQFYLSQGYSYIYYDALSDTRDGGVIQVDTPDSSIRAFDRAVFRVDMPDQYTDVAVYKGYIEAENSVGISRVNAGQMLSLGENTNGEVSPMGPPDEWEDWNKARNDRARELRGESSRYLPAELRAYSYDFDSGGRWVHVPDYGYVWTPTAGVGPGWAPYREGRWIWRGGEYVWVAYEPWGWAPYHYGRWTFLTNVGWCWVPPSAGAVIWGPGYVGWVRTSDYVAWVPLAPGEVYYGRGHYGPHSVDISTVNVNQIKITNVYKNVYINNGVTVVNRNTFATGSPKYVRVEQNVIQQKIFVKNNISIGTPAIRPTRASYFASTKPIPQAMRPPERIRDLHVKELKKSRPFVRIPERSVLNPGEKPKPLPLNAITTPKIRGKAKPSIQPISPLEREKRKTREVVPSATGIIKQGGPEERGEKISPEVTGAPKVKKKRSSPEELNRTGRPEGVPPGLMKKQISPEEQEKRVRPEVDMSPKVLKKRGMTEEKEKKISPDVEGTPKVIKKRSSPEERDRTIKPEGPPQGIMKKRVIPEGEEKKVRPEGPVHPKNLKKEIPEEDRHKGTKKETDTER